MLGRSAAKGLLNLGGSALRGIGSIFRGGKAARAGDAAASTAKSAGLSDEAATMVGQSAKQAASGGFFSKLATWVGIPVAGATAADVTLNNAEGTSKVIENVGGAFGEGSAELDRQDAEGAADRVRLMQEASGEGFFRSIAAAFGTPLENVRGMFATLIGTIIGALTGNKAFGMGIAANLTSGEYDRIGDDTAAGHRDGSDNDLTAAASPNGPGASGSNGPSGLTFGDGISTAEKLTYGGLGTAAVLGTGAFALRNRGANTPDAPVDGPDRTPKARIPGIAGRFARFAAPIAGAGAAIGLAQGEDGSVPANGQQGPDLSVGANWGNSARNYVRTEWLGLEATEPRVINLDAMVGDLVQTHVLDHTDLDERALGYLQDSGIHAFADGVRDEIGSTGGAVLGFADHYWTKAGEAIGFDMDPAQTAEQIEADWQRDTVALADVDPTTSEVARLGHGAGRVVPYALGAVGAIRGIGTSLAKGGIVGTGGAAVAATEAASLGTAAYDTANDGLSVEVTGPNAEPVHRSLAPGSEIRVSDDIAQKAANDFQADLTAIDNRDLDADIELGFTPHTTKPIPEAEDTWTPQRW